MMNTAYHILVVEDNIGDFILVEDFIIEQIDEPVIKHVKTFNHAKEILEQQHHYNVILLDLSLPDYTGEILIREIVKLCKDIPVVVLTGYTDFDFGVKSLSMGISDYLLKEDLTAVSLYKSIVYSTERRKITSALEASKKQIRNFANQLNNALEEERSHIAREIHDEFGQQLSGLKMALSSLKKQSSNEAEELITILIADVNRSIESVRRIANELRPVIIDKLGLFSALEWLVREFQKKTGIDGHFQANFEQPNIDKNIEINIFRICQEALTNTTKHAFATQINLKIEYIQNRLVVKIIDNGKGIDPETLRNPLSMGLVNIKERASLIGAALMINSDKNEGTAIELILTINDKKNINR